MKRVRPDDDSLSLCSVDAIAEVTACSYLIDVFDLFSLPVGLVSVSSLSWLQKFWRFCQKTLGEPVWCALNTV